VKFTALLTTLLYKVQYRRHVRVLNPKSGPGADKHLDRTVINRIMSASLCTFYRSVASALSVELVSAVSLPGSLVLVPGTWYLCTSQKGKRSKEKGNSSGLRVRVAGLVAILIALRNYGRSYVSRSIEQMMTQWNHAPNSNSNRLILQLRTSDCFPDFQLQKTMNMKPRTFHALKSDKTSELEARVANNADNFIATLMGTLYHFIVSLNFHQIMRSSPLIT
jgi:hypothetical protein